MPAPTPATSELRRTAFIQTLRSAQLFSGLPAADLNRIAAVARLQPLAKGNYLFREGDAAEGFYVVQRGAINVHRVNRSGREQVIHVFRPGESFAEAALASPSGYPADARAEEASAVLLLPKADFLALVAQRPDLALRMLGSMSQHLRVLVGLLDDLTLKNVETRLARWLARRCGPVSGSAPVSFRVETSKKILAAELGTTAETFSRTLARFREAGLLRVRGSIVTVLRPADLETLIARNLGDLPVST